MNWDDVARAMGERMEELGITQVDLAHRSGVGATTVKELLWNRTPRRRSGRTLGALSEALGWPQGHLLAVAQGRADESAPSLEEQLAEIRTRLDDIERRLDERS
ncbi:helix-turn-helix domain-containing protein [Saccharopolyspora sp. NPDC002376]